MVRREDVAHLGLVDLTRKGKRDGHGNPLLQKTADLAGAVDLSADRRGPEVVLGANGGSAFPARAAHHQGSRIGCKLKVHINTCLDFLRELAPVGGGKGALRLQLGRSNPVITLVLGAVGKSRLWASVEALSLPDRFEAKSEARSNGLQVASNENAGQTTFQETRVECLEGRREIGASIVVVNLKQTLAASSHDLGVGFGDQRLVPAPVVDGGKSTVTAEVALHEYLLQQSPSDS